MLPSFAFEDIPLFPQNSGLNIEYVEDQQSLINTAKMKKADLIKKSGSMSNENSKIRFRFDERQINNQRALDYTTRLNNSTLLPRF